MNFLAWSPQAAWSLLGAVALAILLFYLLKPPPKRLVVASNLIWNRLLKEKKASFDRWRWLVSLLLALAIGLSLALALTRPELAAIGGEAKRMILVLDNSQSMATRTADGATRWEHARARARALIDGAGAGSEFLIADTMHQAGAPAFVTRTAALAALDKLHVTGGGRARFPTLPDEEKSVRSRAGVAARYFLSDGVAPLQAPRDVRSVSVFEDADNAAITAFEAQAVPSDPTRYEAFVQIFNASPAPKSVELTLSGGGKFREARKVEVPARASANQVIEVTRFAGGLLRASVLAERDAFEPDNVAYAFVDAHRVRRVLLVTRGNRFLQDSLDLQPGIALKVVAPERYDEPLAIDVLVFDRFAPRVRPSVPALLFDPPPADWLPSRSSPIRRPAITAWNAAHPIVQNLALKDLIVERAALAQVNAADAGANATSAIVSAHGSAAGALIAARDSAPRMIDVAFALEESNLHLHADLPLFLGNALNWLGERQPVLPRQVGLVEVALKNAQVTGLDNAKVASVATPSGIAFEANEPGFFTVASDTERVQVIVNALDMKRSDVNATRFGADEKQSSAFIANRPPRWRIESWVVLLAAACALLILEWVTFNRKITL